MSDLTFGPPKQIISSIYEFTPEALEQLAQWLETRGIRVPIGQVVGYQQERFVSFVSGGTQSINDSSETVLTLETVFYDPQKAFDNTNDGIVCPYNGLYYGFASVRWDNLSGAGDRRVALLCANSERSVDIRPGAPTAFTLNAGCTLGAFFSAVAGDLVKVTGWQNSGAALDCRNPKKLAVMLITKY